MGQDHNDKDNKNSHRLMDDQEFTSTMEASYAKEKPPVDEIKKETIWNSIDRSINDEAKLIAKNPKRFWHPGKGTLSILALAALVSIFVFYRADFFNHEDGVSGIKGVDEIRQISIEPLIYLSSGAMQPKKVGEELLNKTLVFKIKADAASIAVLVLKEGLEKPKVVSDYMKLNSSAEYFVEAGNDFFGYRVTASTKDLYICALSAQSEGKLAQSLAGSEIEKIWGKLSKNSCFSVKTIEKGL